MNDAAPVEVAASRPGLYVHVPFCQTKCPYCDFFSEVHPERAGAWLGALEREAELLSGQWARFDTLYLGGGTPSLLSPAQIEQLFALLGRAFDLSAVEEVTLEVNPDDVTESRLAAWRSVGVNRLSVGVQSFREDELRFLRRRHNALQARQAFEQAGAAGFDNLALDLMFGLPGQSTAQWAESLEQALACGPTHLSCYELTLVPGTPLDDQRRSGHLQPLEEGVVAELFVATHDRLLEAGFEHYEVSNYAQGSGLRSRHNVKYWQHVPVLGLGPAAHSFDGQSRWWNISSVTDYHARLATGDLAGVRGGQEQLTPRQLRLERLMFGFRTSRGVALEELEETPRSDEVLAPLVRDGLLVVQAGRVTPTVRGFLVADGLPLLF